jgi:preprotein translocase subunit YajC
MSLIFLIALPVLMYFLLIRPQQRRAREQRDLLSAVVEGDEVMTSGGIYGYVNAVEDDTIWLDIADGVEIRIARGAVAKRIPAATDAADAAEAVDAAQAVDGAAEADDTHTLADPSTNGTAPDTLTDAPAEETPKAGPEAER